MYWFASAQMRGQSVSPARKQLMTLQNLMIMVLMTTMMMMVSYGVVGSWKQKKERRK